MAGQKGRDGGDRMRFKFEADTSKRSGCCVYRSSKDLTMISGTDLAADWLTTASQFWGGFDANGSGSLFSISLHLSPSLHVSDAPNSKQLALHVNPCSCMFHHLERAFPSSDL